MGVPAEQVLLIDSAGNAIPLDVLVERVRGEPERIFGR